jgi:hypothetical protein
MGFIDTPFSIVVQFSISAVIAAKMSKIALNIIYCFIINNRILEINNEDIGSMAL